MTGFLEPSAGASPRRDATPSYSSKYGIPNKQMMIRWLQPRDLMHRACCTELKADFIVTGAGGVTHCPAGTAVVEGHDIRTDMASVYSLMGVCPQHDLLWPQLTAAEHLRFYGRVKGLKASFGFASYCHRRPWSALCYREQGACPCRSERSGRWRLPLCLQNVTSHTSLACQPCLQSPGLWNPGNDGSAHCTFDISQSNLAPEAAFTVRNRRAQSSRTRSTAA